MPKQVQHDALGTRARLDTVTTLCYRHPELVSGALPPACPVTLNSFQGLSLQPVTLNSFQGLQMPKQVRHDSTDAIRC